MNQDKDSSPHHRKSLRQKNRAILWLLWGLVALFYILALVRMGG